MKAQSEVGQVRDNGVALAIGLCVGLLVGVTVAPRSGADARHLVARFLHKAPTLWGLLGRLTEELAEDLAV